MAARFLVPTAPCYLSSRGCLPNHV